MRVRAWAIRNSRVLSKECTGGVYFVLMVLIMLLNVSWRVYHYPTLPYPRLIVVVWYPLLDRWTLSCLYNVLMQLDDSLKGEVTADYISKGVATKVTVDTEGSWAKASTCVTASGFRVSWGSMLHMPKEAFLFMTSSLSCRVKRYFLLDCCLRFGDLKCRWWCRCRVDALVISWTFFPPPLHDFWQSAFVLPIAIFCLGKSSAHLKLCSWSAKRICSMLVERLLLDFWIVGVVERWFSCHSMVCLFEPVGTLLENEKSFVYFFRVFVGMLFFVIVLYKRFVFPWFSWFSCYGVLAAGWIRGL